MSAKARQEASPRPDVDRRPGTSKPEGEARFAYLLMTHRDPAHIEDLVDRVLELSPHGHVVVHHDVGALGPLPYGGRGPERVHFTERRRILWGDWSIVDRTLQMMRDAIRLADADWFVIISGEHRPVTDLGQWERATVASGADALVEADALAPRLRFGRGSGRAEEDAQMFLARCLHRWVSMDQPRNGVAHRGVGGLWKISRYVQPLAAIEYSHRRKTWFYGTPRPRGPLTGWTFYKGTQWIAFNRRAAETVLGTDAAVTEWFSHGHIPDETYLQTVLNHDPSLDVRNEVVTYVPPMELPAPGQTRWMVLGNEDLPTVWASGAAFARKVDPVERPDVLRAIDEEVERRRAVVSEASSQTTSPQE
jgi:Core-2/I-Branching enzyme